MTRAETAEIMTLLQAIYPDSFRGVSNEMMKMRVALWASAFSDDPKILVQAAVQAWISTDTKGFAPVPGQIKEQIAILKNQSEITEQEAWDIVMIALRNSAYNSQEEYAKLPEEIKRAVGSHNMLRSWASVNYNELQTIIASQFKNAYKAIAAKKKNFDKIPEKVKSITSEEEVKQLQA